MLIRNPHTCESTCKAINKGHTLTHTDTLGKEIQSCYHFNPLPLIWTISLTVSLWLLGGDKSTGLTQRPGCCSSLHTPGCHNTHASPLEEEIKIFSGETDMMDRHGDTHVEPHFHPSTNLLAGADRRGHGALCAAPLHVSGLGAFKHGKWLEITAR